MSLYLLQIKIMAGSHDNIRIKVEFRYIYDTPNWSFIFSLPDTSSASAGLEASQFCCLNSAYVSILSGQGGGHLPRPFTKALGPSSGRVCDPR